MKEHIESVICIEGVVEYVDDHMCVIRSEEGFITFEDYKSKGILEHYELDLKVGRTVEIYKINGEQLLLDDLHLEHISKEEVLEILRECGVEDPRDKK